jgi:ureidoglycolate lyase
MTSTVLDAPKLRTLTPVVATAESLEGYGYLIGEPAGLKRDKIDFYGKEVRVSQPARFHGNDDLCLNLVTFQPRPLTVKWMEFHTKHTQTFIQPDGRWDESQSTLPDADNVTAFYFDGSGGIVMDVGVWHEVPFPLDGETHFVCICTNETNDNLEAQGADGDCEGGDLSKRNLVKHLGYTFAIQP